MKDFWILSLWESSVCPYVLPKIRGAIAVYSFCRSCDFLTRGLFHRHAFIARPQTATCVLHDGFAFSEKK